VRGEEGFGDSRAVWRARLILFICFALMAGGFGYANVAESVSLMLSAVVLWIAQSRSGECEYNLSI
jgi:hypothetical protein